MPAFDTLGEVILYVESVERLHEFYTEVFGLEPTRGAPEHGFVAFDVGGCELALHAGRDGDNGRWAPKLVFDVEDLGAARDHLAAHDVEFGDVRNPAPGTYVIDSRDPEGNRFSIEASAPPG